MTTLTEFLEARITEDAKRWATADPPWNAPHDPDCQYPGDMPGTCTCDLLDRLKAECEAKRGAIEAAWQDHSQIEGEWGSCRSREQMSAKDDNPAVVEWLALPYADHPDYREEWRP